MISGILASLMLAAATTGSDCADALDRLLDRLAAADAGELTFVEHRHSELLTEPQRASGTLRREEGGRLVREIFKPTRQTQVLTESHVEIRRADGSQRRFSLRRAPELATLRRALHGLLSGQAEVLREDFVPSLDSAEGDGPWQLTLEPRAPELAERVERLVVDGSGARITGFEMHLSDGEIIRTEIDPQQ